MRERHPLRLLYERGPFVCAAFTARRIAWQCHSMAAAMSLLIAILCATTAQLVVAFIARRPLGASLRGVRSWRDVTFIGTGWLPATPEGADFTADQVPAIVSANAFIDALAELPLATWLDIGRSLADGRPNSAARD